MRVLNPDTLASGQGDELQDRLRRTGEVGNGKTVVCRPDLTNPDVVQQVHRPSCLTMPYAACPYCPHSRFEYVFAIPTQQDWVLCPRWRREEGTGAPSYYVPVWMSECHAKTQGFCEKCPSREELADLFTDKQKEGWLERWKKLTAEEESEEP